MQLTISGSPHAEAEQLYNFTMLYIWHRLMKSNQRWAHAVEGKATLYLKRKGYSMDNCGTSALQPTSQFKMADQFTQLTLGVTQHCSVLASPLQKFLC